MFHLRRACCVLLLSFAGLFSSSHYDCLAQSQSRLASISGTVFDPSGARIPRASINLQNEVSSQTFDLHTDGEGNFAVSVPPGNYQIAISASGFAVYQGSLSLVSSAAAVHFEFPLVIAVNPEKVIVPVDDETDTSGSSNLSSLVFQGPELSTFSSDDATFQKEIEALAGSIGGKAPTFIVDGFTGGKPPSKSAIASIRINRNPYSAMYDTFGTSRIEIATKPGAEKFHGQFFVLGTDSHFDALNPYITAPSPPFSMLTFDGNLNGPIDRRSSFFFSGDYNDQQSNAALNAIVATNGQRANYSLAVRDPVSTADYTLRIDRQMSPANTFTGRYEFNQINQTNGGLLTPLTLASQAYNSGFTTQTLRLSDTQIHGASLIFDSHLQYIRSRQRQDALSSAPTLRVEGAFNGGGNPQQSLRDNQDNLELQEAISVDSGSHYLRFGARYRLLRDANLATANYNGQYTFPTIQSYIAGVPTLYTQTVGQKDFSLLTGDLAVWAEDEWRIAKGLTLDAGFRLESQSAIPDHVNPAPRLGVAWALYRRKKSVPFLTLRSGTGIFYDRFPAADILTTVRQNGVSQQTFELANPCYNPSGAPLTTAGCPALAATPPTPYRIDPNFKAEYGWYSGLTAERTIARHGTVSVRYVVIRGIHQTDSLNINAPLPGTYNPANPGSGTRPFGGSQNIYEFSSNGIVKSQSLGVNSRLTLTKRLGVFVSYNYTYQHQDVTNATTFASNSYDVSQDYGRAPQPRQQMFTGGNLQLPLGLSLNAFASVQSGIPFNVTTGTDLNGDTIYNDRPAFATHPTASSVLYNTHFGAFDANPQPGETIVPAYSGNSPRFSFLELSAQRTFQLGARPETPQAAPGTKPAPRPDRPFALTFTVDAYNVFNAHNPGQPVGVLSSPYFGQSTTLNNPFSTNTAANRIVYLQAQFSF